MVSVISTATHFSKRHFFSTHLSFSPINPQKGVHCRRKAGIVNLVLGHYICFFRLVKLSKDRANCCCRKGWASEGDIELEEEILAFMEISENPNAFPTRKELEKAGRVDLTEAIKTRGGWFSFGWESEDDDTSTVNVNEVEAVEMDFDSEEFHRRVKSCQESDSLHGNEAYSLGSDSADASIGNSSQPASCSEKP